MLIGEGMKVADFYRVGFCQKNDATPKWIFKGGHLIFRVKLSYFLETN